MSKEVLTELRKRKEVYKRWKQRKVTRDRCCLMVSLVKP